MINLWKQDYLLDIDTIDEQHKHFFEMTAQIIQLAEKLHDDNSVEKIIQAVGALRAYAFLHFKTEEELQLKYAFSGYMRHTTFHNSYLENMIFFEQKFKDLLNRKKKGEEISSAMEEYLIDMADYVAHWWAEHIVKQDTIYADFIRKCRNKNGTLE